MLDVFYEKSYLGIAYCYKYVGDFNTLC